MKGITLMFTLNIAGVRFNITSDLKSDIPRTFLKDHFGGFMSNGGPTKKDLPLHLSMENGRMDVSQGKVIYQQNGSCLYYNPLNRNVNLVVKGLGGFTSLYTTIYLLTSMTLTEEDGCLFHGAGVVHRGKGYLFIGPSGAGKTTVAGLLVAPACEQTKAGDKPPRYKGWKVLSDDAIAMRRKDGRYLIHSTPFGSGGAYPQDSAPLSHILVLKKDRVDYRERLTPMDAMGHLIPDIPFIRFFERDNIERLMSLGYSLAKDLPVSLLHFTRDPKTLKEVITYG
ncbi:MAG: hypothetical protein HY878_03100 [Deltaproteobacteria bacterium]|nr:hypothetical protein [Deltaproteobacteria bacterium]